MTDKESKPLEEQIKGLECENCYCKPCNCYNSRNSLIPRNVVIALIRQKKEEIERNMDDKKFVCPHCKKKSVSLAEDYIERPTLLRILGKFEKKPKLVVRDGTPTAIAKFIREREG